MKTTGVYGGVSAEERIAQRRERLLAAARTLFDAGGIAKVTVTGVCAEAGLNDRYFYESFSDRHAILDELFAVIASETAAVIFARAASGSTDLHERARLAVDAAIDAFSPGAPMSQAIAGPAPAADEITRHRLALTRHVAKLSVDFAPLFFAEDTPPPAAIHSIAAFIVAGAVELVADWLQGELDLTREELVDCCTELIWGALTSKVAGGAFTERG